ncbi:MAG: hypothetical protein KGS09_20995 [Nitrospirae bacterium]|nr:hypothetical protein [Nitrospirota bacterium]
MIAGIYSAKFLSNNNLMGFGIVVIDGATLHGGDLSCLYKGKYRLDDNKISATVDVENYTGQVQAINATPSGVQWSGRVIVMGHMGRPSLSAAQKVDLWQRWKQGQSLSEIGRAIGYTPGRGAAPRSAPRRTRGWRWRSRLPTSAHVRPTGQNGYVMS